MVRPPGAERRFQAARWNAQAGASPAQEGAHETTARFQTEHSPIELNLLGAGQTAGPERNERANGYGGDNDAEKTATNAQHAALRRGTRRARRPRPAPSATRMANSRSREMARVSRRLAIFTQAMQSSNPTADSRQPDGTRPTSPTRSSLKRCTRIAIPAVRFRILFRPNDSRPPQFRTGPRQA